MSNIIKLSAIVIDRAIKPCRKYSCKRCGVVFYTRKCGVPKYCSDCRVTVYDEKYKRQQRRGKGFSSKPTDKP